MIDVGEKPVTARTATASAHVTVSPEVFDAVVAGRVPKGDVLTTARVAGIMAAKRTADLLPLCHPLPLDAVEVDVRAEPPDAIEIVATARTHARTGVEMEALTAVSAAALTVYDMCKSLQKDIEIGPIRLERKSGGRSGDYSRKCPSA
jgi:cyclic pyranopterin phosphate synthase